VAQAAGRAPSRLSPSHGQSIQRRRRRRSRLQTLPGREQGDNRGTPHVLVRVFLQPRIKLGGMGASGLVESVQVERAVDVGGASSHLARAHDSRWMPIEHLAHPHLDLFAATRGAVELDCARNDPARARQACRPATTGATGHVAVGPRTARLAKYVWHPGLLRSGAGCNQMSAVGSIIAQVRRLRIRT
jgi:hypothetical protein